MEISFNYTVGKKVYVWLSVPVRVVVWHNLKPTNISNICKQTECEILQLIMAHCHLIKCFPLWKMKVLSKRFYWMSSKLTHKQPKLPLLLSTMWTHTLWHSKQNNRKTQIKETISIRIENKQSFFSFLFLFLSSIFIFYSIR